MLMIAKYNFLNIMTPKEQTERQGILTVAHHDFEKGLNARAFFKLNDRALGEGIVQETFMKTWIYLVKGGKIDLMKAFLYHVLNNLIVDEYRKRKNSSLDIMLEKGFDLSTGNTDPLINFLDGKTAVKLIQHLPKKYQEVMCMCHLQDLSLKEISNITGQTKNAIAVQLHRGLQKLKILYKEENA
jgi:RNA polymerase sigma-70 factor, ECF subfamily